METTLVITIFMNAMVLGTYAQFNVYGGLDALNRGLYGGTAGIYGTVGLNGLNTGFNAVNGGFLGGNRGFNPLIQQQAFLPQFNNGFNQFQTFNGNAAIGNAAFPFAGQFPDQFNGLNGGQLGNGFNGLNGGQFGNGFNGLNGGQLGFNGGQFGFNRGQFGNGFNGIGGRGLINDGTTGTGILGRR